VLGRVGRGLLALIALAPAATQAETAVRPHLRIMAEERYDDDALLRQAGHSQFMTKLTPQVGLELEQRRGLLDGWYAADLLMRHGSGDLSLDHRAGLDGHYRLSRRLTLSAEGRLWQVSDPTSLPRVGMARSFSPVLYGTGELAGTALLTRRWTARTAYRFEGTQVYEDGRPPGSVHAPTAEAWYALDRRLSLGGEYRYQLFLFGAQQGQAHAPAATVRYRLSRLARLTGRAGPALYQGPSSGGLLPRVNLELSREGHGLELGMVAGQDLVGASGYTSALWAQYASAVAAAQLGRSFRLYGAASYYRNGLAPGSVEEWAGRGGPASSDGYGLAVGGEWRFAPKLSLQAQADRIAQVGTAEVEALARNVAALRLVWAPW
jgi:hypothetical protein